MTGARDTETSFTMAATKALLTIPTLPDDPQKTSDRYG
jgi:hypothetical protein